MNLEIAVKAFVALRVAFVVKTRRLALSATYHVGRMDGHPDALPIGRRIPLSPEQFRCFVKSRAGELGISIVETSRRAGLSHSTVHRYLTGMCAPTAANIVRLAGALECDPGSLLCTGERQH